MGTIIFAELLLIVLFLFWPASKEPDSSHIIFEDKDVTQIQAPVRTQQESSPPPPPSPEIPIPVPNDQPVQDRIKFPHKIASDATDSLSVTPGTGGNGDSSISGNPQIGPKIIKIEEPTFENRSPEKADIYVKMLVSKKGNVESAVIDRIFLYDKHGNPTIRVQTLNDKEIIQKTIKAALKWKFHPAKDHGKAVRAYSINIFTVDY